MVTMRDIYKLDYEKMDELLHHRGTGKPMEFRRLSRNTYLKRKPDNGITPIRGALALTLHYTDVLTFHPNGEVALRSGGWQTVTTKDRINHVADIQVFSGRRTRREESYWWVHHQSWGDWWDLKPDKWVPFIDNITINQETGKILTPESDLREALENRDAGPTWHQTITKYLGLTLDSRSLKRLATQGESCAPHRDPNTLRAREVLSHGYLDLRILLEALKFDAVKRGDLEGDWGKTLVEDWLPIISKGKQPPRIKTVIRNYIKQFAPYEFIRFSDLMEVA